MFAALRNFFREAGVIVTVATVVPIVFITIVILQQLWLAFFGWAPLLDLVASLS